MRGTVLLIVILFVGNMTLLAIPPRAAAAILTGSSSTPTTVDLSWTPECLSGPITYPCEGSRTDGYGIYLKNGSYLDSWHSIEYISNTAVTTYTVIGLQPGTTYQFYVLESLGWGGFNSNIITVQTLSLPNERPSLSVTAPTADLSFVAGQQILITWELCDDRDSPEDLVVYLNFTGPTSGTIAGPLSGTTQSLGWTVPTGGSGSGYRIMVRAIDSEGAWRVAESAAFTILPQSGEPGDGGTVWIISTALLSVIVAGLTAGLLLAVRVQLADWYHRRRDRTKQRQT